MHTSNTISSKPSVSKKIMLGFASLASAAVIGTIGVVSASPDGKPKNMADCQQMGFSTKNYGQCVKDWAHSKKSYGGDKDKPQFTKVHTDVHAEANINGDNNVVQFFVNVYNYFL